MNDLDRESDVEWEWLEERLLCVQKRTGAKTLENNLVYQRDYVNGILFQ